MMFNLRTEKCPICGKEMMDIDKWQLFPYGYDQTQEMQMKQKGVVFKSNATKDGDFICVECAKKGLSSFICVLCDKEYPTDEIQSSFGDPAEYLCETCYSTTPAKVWEKVVEQLEESHKWDFM